MRFLGALSTRLLISLSCFLILLSKQKKTGGTLIAENTSLIGFFKRELIDALTSVPPHGFSPKVIDYFGVIRSVVCLVEVELGCRVG